MTAFLKKTTSLNNLKSASRAGQIATLLILMIVGLLILILVTVNIGQVSVTNTSLSNTADSAVLSLASQLSTRASMTYHNLGDKMKKTARTGALGVVLAVVLAIITVATLGASSPYTVPAAIAAGAIGGAVGNVAVQGSCTWGTVGTGALQGAIIGAAIGGGAAQLGTSGATVGGTGVGAPSSTLALELVDLGFISPAEMAITVPTGVTIITSSTIGATAGVTLAAGSNLYNTSVSERAVAKALSEAHKAVNGLMDYDRFRESVFLQALTQVDDPNKEKDDGKYTYIDASGQKLTIDCEKDLNSDGQSDDEIPRFYKWWDSRVKDLKAIVPVLKGIIEGYFNGPFADFRNFSEVQYTQQCQTYGDPEGGSATSCTFGPLCRQELEDSDGVIIKLLRDLDAAGQGITDAQGKKIWQPMPNKQDLLQQSNCSCGQGNEDEDEDEDDNCCPPLPGMDNIDGIIDNLHDFVETFDALKSQGSQVMTSTYQSWKNWFYDESLHPNGDIPESIAIDEQDTESEKDTDYYIQFKKVSDELETLKQAIITKRTFLPNCSYQDDAVIGYPCKDVSRGDWATSNADLNDEFNAALNAIEELRARVDNFRVQLENFADAMEAAYANANFKTKYGGVNPVTYKWNDSRGEHSVSVETGPYKLPYVQKIKRGDWLIGKTTFYLRNYSDGGSSTWVRITRRDPANKDSGIAGMWNTYINPDPYAKIDGAPAGMFSVTKISSAYWGYDKSGGRAGLTKKK